MEKERRSGQPNHRRPLESLSGSSPEKTVMLAREQVATLSVITSRDSSVSTLPSKNSETTNV